MDLSFTPPSGRSRPRRGRGSANLGLPPPFATLDDEVAWGRQWQARLAADRWVGIHWPDGRTAAAAPRPVQVALFNMEYARAGRPQPVNRVGINLAGPTLLAHGTDEQKQRWLPDDPRRLRDLVPAVQRARRRLRPGVAHHPGRARDGRRPGWLLTGQKVWTSYAQFARWGICLARTDPDAPKHRGISYLVVDMEAPGIEIRPLRADHRRGRVQRGVPRRRVRAGRPPRRRAAPRAGRWPTPPWPTSGARNFPFKEQVVHEVLPRRPVSLAARRGALDDEVVDDAWSRRSSSCGCCACTTGAPCRAWAGASSPGPSRAGSSCTGPT